MMKNTSALAAIMLALAILPGCGADIPGRGVSATNNGDTQQTTPTTTVPKYDSAPSTPNQSGYDIGLNLPRTIPVISTQSKPGEVTMKAVANTATITPLIDAGVSRLTTLRTVSISATLTWGKVSGAANYRVSRSIDNEDQTNKSKYQTRSTVSGSLGFYIDGGKVIDNLTPGRLYSYKVEALDNMGRVLAEGNSSVTPLYPINPPEQVSPAPLNPTKPEPAANLEFSWNKIGDADGYYLEVFSASTMVPMWGCYKNVAEKVTARYGELGDKMIGTIPITWGMMLTPGARYAWSLAAVKSNNPDSSKATAFARANTPIRFFIAP